MADIMRDARHATISNAVKYKKDAEYLLELSRLNNEQFEGKKTDTLQNIKRIGADANANLEID